MIAEGIGECLWACEGKRSSDIRLWLCGSALPLGLSSMKVESCYASLFL